MEGKQPDVPAKNEGTGQAPNLPQEETPLALASSRLQGLRQTLDPLFAEVGLSFVPSEGAALIYGGVVEGRSVQVECSVRTMNRYATSSISYRQFVGLNLAIVVETPLQTQLVVSQPLRVSLGGADNVFVRAVIHGGERFNRKKHRLAQVSIPKDQHPVRARADDINWAATILNSAVRAKLWDLLPERDLGILGPVDQWSLSFTPGEARLSITPAGETLNRPNLAHWLSSAVWFTQQGERVEPAEMTTPAPPKLEPMSRAEARNKILPKILIGLGCIVMVPFLLAAFFGIGYWLIGEWVMLFPIVFAFFFMPYAMYLLVRNKARSLARAQRIKNDPHWSQVTAAEPAAS